ncbi:MAG: metal ABC transporter permease [Candidatus Eisenbacteria bacterium]|nr:metal ABC transporter permease [Candidatus Eisenbacteria bacterium]
MTDFFSYPGAMGAIVVAVLTGVFLSLLGIPLVLRRRSFTGVALAETAALGGALGAWMGAPRYVTPLLLAAGVLVLLELVRSRRTGEDGPVALCYLAAASGATLFVSKLPAGEADMMSLHFGNVLSINSSDVLVSIVVAAAGIVLFSLCARCLLATLNDPVSARATGLRPPRVRLAYAALLAVGVTFGLSVLGVVPVVAYLVAPAFVGLRVAATVRGWGIAAALTASLASCAGLVGSFALDFPPGPFVACLLALVGFAAWAVRR